MDDIRTAIVIRRWIEILHRDRKLYSPDIAAVLQACGWMNCDSAAVLVLFERWSIQRLHTAVHDPRVPHPGQQSGLDW